MKTIESLEPKVIFPMHNRRQEERYRQFASDLRELGFTKQVICPQKRGDAFFFKDGTVKQKIF